MNILYTTEYTVHYTVHKYENMIYMPHVLECN